MVQPWTFDVVVVDTDIGINRLITVYMNVIMWISSHIDLLPRIGGEVCIVCIGMRLFPNFESRLLYWDGKSIESFVLLRRLSGLYQRA